MSPFGADGGRQPPAHGRAGGGSAATLCGAARLPLPRAFPVRPVRCHVLAFRPAPEFLRYQTGPSRAGTHGRLARVEPARTVRRSRNAATREQRSARDRGEPHRLPLYRVGPEQWLRMPLGMAADCTLVGVLRHGLAKWGSII